MAKHYYRFDDALQNKLIGGRLNEENWNILRNDELDGPFSIENSVEAYETNCRGAKQYEEIANIIVREIDDSSEKIIVSLGVGKGILEWHLKNINPDIHVCCTDYTADAIEKLKSVFIKMDEAFVFDIFLGDYKKLGFASYIVLHRVSTEFNRKQWMTIIKSMHDCGIDNIIFIPTELAPLKLMLKEEFRHVKNRIKRHKDVSCGWLYSEKEFDKMFKGKQKKTPLYKISRRMLIDNTAVYFLRRNDLH